MMDTQPEIDAMAEALRAQGLTWSQTNFAVSLVRNAAAAERERIAAHFDRRDKGAGGWYDPHEPAEIIRARRALNTMDQGQCKGAWELGTACGKCSRCEATKPGLLTPARCNRSEMMDAQEQIFRLWRMLDDIDTLDDTCRENDAAFRTLARDVQRKRFDVLPGPAFESLWRVYWPNV